MWSPFSAAGTNSLAARSSAGGASDIDMQPRPTILASPASRIRRRAPAPVRERSAGIVSPRFPAAPDPAPQNPPHPGHSEQHAGQANRGDAADLPRRTPEHHAQPAAGNEQQAD